jgi:hypothetical protein
MNEMCSFFLGFLVKSVVSHSFCLQQNDIASYVNDSLKDGTEISYFRKDKIGVDGTATSYW